MSLSDFLKKKEFPTLATATLATVATVAQKTGNYSAAKAPCVADVAVVAVANLKKVAANDQPQADPDRHCYPHSDAMNGSELSTMATRLATFARIGMDVDESERMADKLLIRDREHDDRHVCLECSSLTGGTGNWRCMAFRQRGARDPGMPADYIAMLTRCQSFVAGQPSTSSSYTTARPANETRLVQRTGRRPVVWSADSEGDAV